MNRAQPACPVVLEERDAVAGIGEVLKALIAVVAEGNGFGRDTLADGHDAAHHVALDGDPLADLVLDFGEKSVGVKAEGRSAMRDETPRHSDLFEPRGADGFVEPFKIGAVEEERVAAVVVPVDGDGWPRKAFEPCLE